MKMKEIGPRGRPWCPPPDPRMQMTTSLLADIFDTVLVCEGIALLHTPSQR